MVVQTAQIFVMFNQHTTKYRRLPPFLIQSRQDYVGEVSLWATKG